MRFCTQCGNSLPGLGPAPAAPPAAANAAAYAPTVAGPSPVHGGAPAPTPVMMPAAQGFNPPPASSPLASAGAEVAERLSNAIGGPLCWRCRGVGDVGAEFCKFCGARYADKPGAAPGQAAPAASPMAPQAAPAPAASPMAPQAAPMAAPPAAHGFGPATMPVEARGPESYGAPSAGHAPGGVGAAPAPVLARLVSILKDGTDGQAFAITQEQTDIGRTEGEILLADDPYLSPRHARIRRRGDAFFLRDLDSVNGIYLRIRDAVELADGDTVLVGQQVLRFELLSDAEVPVGPAAVHGVFVFGTPEVPRIARLVQYTTEGIGRDIIYLYRSETVLGRETGDVVFTDDPFLSRRHAAIRVERGSRRFVLKDMGSSNGTSLRMKGERPLSHNDLFRIGRHLFRFELASAQAGQAGR